ncbi:enoyl-CoA hydratase domain-containing protein 2, mitochondrial isoform X1 [Grammomys surdaster]|uniref:enoyl-CoA hydratase domain-containing protein 2, mitochondrial isoform X1 n=2 Tax=Grammomys surdaster TaxID=491861 RepID=UPI00109FBB21|nr:enoyl-CoA hydratase domain-containing protein 2, mitochondrial isoform X1 [Grammomys surdaster]
MSAHKVALELGTSKKINIYMDSRYAFATAHVHGAIYQERGLTAHVRGNLGSLGCPDEAGNCGALVETLPAPELRLSSSAEEVAVLRATSPACSPMLRALPRALRLPRPWMSPGARDCASHATTRTPEIQVQALTGPNQGITEILMNRPHARNALGNVFVSELLEALAQLREDQQVRVLLFRSAVKGVFCAGADLKERERMGAVEVGTFVQRLRGLMNEIAAFPAPTIAAMDGFALGGGLELALACDLRIAASSAVMGLIETTRGLLPGAGGTQRLPRCLGVPLAKELIFTGRRLNGAQAHELGLVNHAVAQNEEGDAAYHRALALAQEILPQAPIAVRLGKVAIDRGMEVDIASGMAIEQMCYAQNIPTQDRLEGMAAFREKRPPKFVGK